MKPALLIIDMQEAYHVGKAAASMDSAAEYIKEVLSYFRKADLPVVWVHHEDRENGVVPGAPGFEMIESLKKLAKEYTIHKRYGNGFNRTDCAEILRQNGVDTVIVSGSAQSTRPLNIQETETRFRSFLLRGESPA
jgi:nicotinamidase-related amidase